MTKQNIASYPFTVKNIPFINSEKKVIALLLVMVSLWHPSIKLKHGTQAAVCHFTWIQIYKVVMETNLLPKKEEEEKNKQKEKKKTDIKYTRYKRRRILRVEQ